MKGMKTGGRRPGSGNKKSKDPTVRLAVHDFLAGELTGPGFKALYDALTPRERMNAIIRLLPFDIPQFSSVAYEAAEPEDEGLTGLLASLVGGQE